MKRIILSIVFTSISGLCLFAQKGNIEGVIKDKSNNEIVRSATLSLFSIKENKLIKSTLSDSSGFFELKDLPVDSFNLKITSVGFQTNTIVVLVNDNNKNSITVFLERQGKDLSAVTIIAKAPSVTQKDDTAQYNANQYKVNPDATTEDLVKKMPGITIDKNGAITAHGEQVKKITVDGKDFFGDDATAALKNIPATVVDKIQVFDKLSDQAQLTGIDDGNSQKSINIITKAGINNAQFGRIYAGIGNDNKYSAGGNISFFKNDRRISIVGNFNNVNQQNFGSQDLLGLTGSKGNASGSYRGPGAPAESFSTDQASGISSTNAAGINYSDKWGKRATITGSYFFNNSKNDNVSITNNNSFEENQTTYKESDANTNNFNHRINSRLEYKLDSNNIIFIIPSLSFQTNNALSSNNIQSYKNADDSLYNSTSSSIKDKAGYNIKNNIMFRHSFKKKNRIFSMGFNTNFTKNDGESTIDGLYRFYDILGLPIYPDSLQQQYSDNKTNGYTLGGTITYNEPLGKKGRGQLQFEFNPTFQKNKANQQTYALDGLLYSKFDTALSNQFNNTTVTNNGGITYRFTRSKDEQMSVNINYQESKLMSDRILPNATNVNQTFRNFLPYAYWRKKISKSSNIRMFYRATTVFPTIAQLQDVVNLSNPTSISSGNKDLKQSNTQYMGSRYSYTNTKTNKSLFANFFIQRSSDYISNATYIAANDSAIQQGIVIRKGSKFTTPINLDGYRTMRSNVTYSTPIKAIKSSVNLSAGFLYSKLPGVVNYISTKTRTYQYNLGIALTSNISEYVDYNISYNAGINRAQTIGTAISNNNYVNQTIVVAFNLLSKKGWFVQNDLTGQVYNGLSGGFDRTFTLWNASVGKKFFKNRTGEVKISVFDILKQNQSISRTITDTYIEDSQSKILRQYFMLTFSYNLKNFGKPKKPAATEEFLPKVGYPGN